MKTKLLKTLILIGLVSFSGVQATTNPDRTLEEVARFESRTNELLDRHFRVVVNEEKANDELSNYEKYLIRESDILVRELGVRLKNLEQNYAINWDIEKHDLKHLLARTQRTLTQLENLQNIRLNQPPTKERY